MKLKYILKGKHQRLILWISLIYVVVFISVGSLLERKYPLFAVLGFILMFFLGTCALYIWTEPDIEEDSILQKLHIKSSNFAELINNYRTIVFSKDFKQFLEKTNDVDEMGYVYTVDFARTLRQSNRIFVFLNVKDMSKFNLERDMHDIWCEIREKYPRLKDETMFYNEKSVIIYCLCVEKDSKEFQEYLYDNKGKYSKQKGSMVTYNRQPIFIKDDNRGLRTFGKGFVNRSITFLATGICFEKKEAYVLVPNGFMYTRAIKKCHSMFVEMMERC